MIKSGYQMKIGFLKDLDAKEVEGSSNLSIK